MWTTSTVQHLTQAGLHFLYFPLTANKVYKTYRCFWEVNIHKNEFSVNFSETKMIAIKNMRYFW